jgi:hypothetical protein
MKYDLFIQTLERGRNVGLGRKFNISDILKENFPVPISTQIDDWNAEIEIQFDILRDMQSQLKIIKFDESQTNKWYWYMGQNKPNWFDETAFEVWVTGTGLDYLNQYYLRQSYFSLNGTLETNTKRQTKVLEDQEGIFEKQTNLYRYTLILTGFNALIGIIILYSTASSNADKLSISTLQSQLSTQQKEIKRVQLLKSDTVHYVLHYPEMKNKSKKN